MDHSQFSQGHGVGVGERGEMRSIPEFPSVNTPVVANVKPPASGY